MDDKAKQEMKKKLNERLNLLMQKKGINFDATLGNKAVEKKVENNQVTDSKQQEKIVDKNPEKTKKIKKEDKKQEKNGHILRKAAGVVWKDKTMQQWPQNDYRIFVGNLGNETSDEVLANAFRLKYPSFNMARVVKDRRTGKTRGYGFVSFAEPRDFLNALKEMNGQYIGNRPAKVIKSNWKDRDLDSAKNQMLPSDFQKNSKKETNKIFNDYKYVHPY